MNTIIIGLGNPILADDGVGIQAARLIREKLKDLPYLSSGHVEVAEVYSGGIRLMDIMLGYSQAFIIDAMLTGQCCPGTIEEFEIYDFPSTRNIISTHDSGLDAALQMGRILGLKVPDTIKILGIEAMDVATFSEELTEPVAAALPVAVDKILASFEALNEAVYINTILTGCCK